MCQLTPFTLPCCDRIYVDVERLPSCPADWPRRKCPADLCIRVHAFKPEERGGDCWRCIAKGEGLDDYATETRRPAFDRAEVVLGFEEITPLERRAMTQDDGRCWFCCSRGGCKSCGAKKIGSYEPEQTIEPVSATSPKPTTSTKRKRADSAYDVKKSKQRGAKKVRIVELKEELSDATPRGHFTRSKASQGFPPPLPRIVEPSIDPLLTQSGPYKDMAYSSTPNFYTGSSYSDLPIALPSNCLSPAQGGAINLQIPGPQGSPPSNLHRPPDYNNSPLVHNYDTTPRTRHENTFSTLQGNFIEARDSGPQCTRTNGAEGRFLQLGHHNLPAAGYSITPSQGTVMFSQDEGNNFSPSGGNVFLRGRANNILRSGMSMFPAPGIGKTNRRGNTEFISDAARQLSPSGGHDVEQPAFNLDNFVLPYNIGSLNDQQLFNEQPSAHRQSDPNASPTPGRYLTPEIPNFNLFDCLFLPEEEDGNSPFDCYPPLPGSAHNSNQQHNGN